MTVEEQCANIFYIRSWYGKYERLCELNKTDTMGCYTDEIANMENVMEEARALWDEEMEEDDNGTSTKHDRYDSRIFPVS